VLNGIGDYVRDVLVGQRVRRLAPMAFYPDQPCPPQNAQVLGYQRLAHPEPFDQFVDESGLFG
jgi:hypothetical protein